MRAGVAVDIAHSVCARPAHVRTRDGDGATASRGRSVPAPNTEAGDESQRWIRYFRRHLQLRKDEVVAAAIQAAPTESGARGLLHLAQQVSECVDGDVSLGDCARLCAVALLIEFAEPFPATQVDAALRCVAHERSQGLLDMERGVPFGALVSVPEFIELDDLADLPLSTILHGVTALHSVTCCALPPPHPFVRGNRAQRRSRSFLRYLVSLQPAQPLCDASRCRNRIAAAARQALADLGGTVRAPCEGPFHEVLFAAMWSHQARRLADVSQDYARHVGADGLRVAVEGGGTRMRPHIRVGFEPSGVSPATDYLLRCRPLEDRERACGRVARIIERAGLRVCTGPGSPGTVLLRL